MCVWYLEWHTDAAFLLQSGVFPTEGISTGRRVFMLVVKWHFQLLATSGCNLVSYYWLKLLALQPSVATHLSWGGVGIWIDLCYSARGGEGAIYMLFAYKEAWSPSLSSQLSQFGGERMKSWSGSWSREMANLHSGAAGQWEEVKKYEPRNDEKHKRGTITNIISFLRKRRKYLCISCDI